ncbi:MAG: hemerythrin domain-containing protein [Burkholderiaceae bacterium]|nr:hemerythrin domain-containing protein [Burkholderiaceae bacterium]
MSTGKTLQVVRREHQTLAAMLHALQTIARDTAPGDAANFDAMRAILFYVDEFPERLHHAKESALLFPPLRRRCPSIGAVLDRLDAEHADGGRAVRDLEHALTAFEQLGEARRGTFLAMLERYVSFYRDHMQIEEREVLPLAERELTQADWAEIDAAFEANRDPLSGYTPEAEYEPLFRKIVQIAPPPIGLGASGRRSVG